MENEKIYKEVKIIHEMVKEQIKNKQLCIMIANLFIKDLNMVEKDTLLEILKYYVECYELLYVNEIRKFLQENSNELFVKYGKNFENILGCNLAFGFESPFAKNPEILFKKKEKIEVNAKEKIYEKKSRKKLRRVKKDAKKRANEKHHQKLQEKEEKKQKRKEFEKLLRKENYN